MAGYDFHNWYGFGKINAAAAISAAETYSTDLGTMVTTGIQYGPSVDVPITYGITPQTVNVPAPTSNPSANTIDFVRVTFKLNHAVPYGVGMELISPQGTVVNILQPLQNINQNPVDVWVAVGVNAFYGEQIAGNWTLQVTDYFDDSNDGILQDWFIEVFGH